MAYLGISGASCSAFLERSHGKGKTPFFTILSGNSRTNGICARGPGMFYFWPVNLYFSLPEWKFHMVFSRFPAALVIFGQFSGNWRCGSGGGWEVPEKALKMVSGWPWGVKIAAQSAHWQKGDRNGLFGGHLALVSDIFRRALRQEKSAVLQKN